MSCRNVVSPAAATSGTYQVIRRSWTVPHQGHSEFLFSLGWIWTGTASLSFWTANAQECGCMVMVCAFASAAELAKPLRSCVCWALSFSPWICLPDVSHSSHIGCQYHLENWLEVEMNIAIIALLHKVVPFLLKYPAILVNCSLLKNNSSCLKASFLSSGKGFFCGFYTRGSQSDVLPSRQESEHPQRVRQQLAVVSRVSPAALRLSAWASWDALHLHAPTATPGREGEVEVEWRRVQKASRGHSFVRCHCSWEPSAITQELNWIT